MPGPASTRVAAVQSWPALKYPAPAMPSAVAAMSASSNTMTGALPPSSRWTRLRSSAAALATSPPAPDGAGDRDHLRDLVRNQRPAGVAVAGDHVEHAWRQELPRDLGQQQRA